MPPNKVHCAISRKRTGKPYQELHKWIDENNESRGVNHRSKNHFYSEDLRGFISANFGGAEAVSEWLFHIALDNLDTSVLNDWNYLGVSSNFHKFGFESNGFIHYDEEQLNEADLDDEFPDDSEGDWE